MQLGTFNMLGDCQISIWRGGDKNEQERFFNFLFSNSYLPISIITIHSSNMKRKSPN